MKCNQYEGLGVPTVLCKFARFQVPALAAMAVLTGVIAAPSPAEPRARPVAAAPVTTAPQLEQPAASTVLDVVERSRADAKGSVLGGDLRLHQAEQYANEGDQVGLYPVVPPIEINPALTTVDRYSREDFADASLDRETKRVAPVAQLTDRRTIDWAELDAPTPASEQAAAIDQVTSVAQLTDVKPTDWAFQSLQSLVERYGVIAGYPDHTFRGNRAMTRYEFAAGLNSAMDRVNELVSQSGANSIQKDDLAALEKLQGDFSAELAQVKTRVGSLEARTMKLATDRFSFTSKLFGLAFFNVTGITGAAGIQRETGFRQGAAATPIVERLGRNPNPTASGLTWLNLGSSFTGKDLLITQLAMGKGVSPGNYVSSATSTVNNFGIPFTDAGAFLGPGAPVTLRELAYEFPVMNTSRLIIGPRINWFRFFDANPLTFFLNGTGSLNAIANPLNSEVRRGAGAILQMPLTEQFDVNLGYLAEANEFLTSNSASSPNEGLFGGTNSISAELVYKPSPSFNVRFLYNRLNSQARNTFVNGGILVTSPIKTVSGAPINGVADDGLGGSLENAQSDVFGLNFHWLVNRKFGVFGRYGFATTKLHAEIKSRDGSITTNSLQAGVAVFDMFKRGAQGTLSFMMPFNYTSGRQFLASGAGDGGTQYELEGVYFYPINQNIALVPNLQVIFHPNNFASNPTVFVFNLRTQFNF
jgi:Carbohydrate-selective porin, OprB family/S-layer homology domain